MRWDDLFSDLEAQLEQIEEGELAGEVAERTRIEVSKFALVDRLRPAFGHTVALSVDGGFPPVIGTLTGVAAEWVLVAAARGQEVMIPMPAILSVAGLGSLTAAAVPEGKVARLLTLGHTLRGIARDRSAVTVALVDGNTLTGTIDRVGADFFELAEHAVDEARRRGNVMGVRTVANRAVSFVRRDG